jgi:hypothetical protein
MVNKKIEACPIQLECGPGAGLDVANMADIRHFRHKNAAAFGSMRWLGETTTLAVRNFQG